MTALSDLLAAAIDRRGPLLERLAAEGTDCVRLLHGATEGAPGVAVDRYGPVLLVQTWRQPLTDVDGLFAAAEHLPGLERLVWNHRPRGRGAPEHPGVDTGGGGAVGHEQGLAYDVTPRHRGRDPLLFLDLRAGRRRVRELAAGQRVLNLFAYTCGVGLAAAAGGAARVENVDFAASALEVGRSNAARNGLPQEFVQEDFFVFARQRAGLSVGGRRRPRHRRYAAEAADLVVLDPPRRARSRFGVVDTVGDYPSLLKPAVLACRPGGAVLATNNVASVDAEEWRESCERSADKAGRPVAAWDWIAPEDDFPSPDDRPPLKIALLRLHA